MSLKLTAKTLVFLLIPAVFLFFLASAASADVGLRVGNDTLNLNSGENILYGVTSASSTNGNFLLFEKGPGNVVFRIDNSGNITTNGSILGSNNYWNYNNGYLSASSTGWNVRVGTVATGSDKFAIAGGRLATLDATSNIYSANLLQSAGVGGNYMMGKLGIGSLASNYNTLGVTGNVSIGSGYLNNAAPTNGLIVEGNVGIGTAVPGAPLNVNSSSYGNPVSSGTTQTYNTLRLSSSGGSVVLDSGINTSNGVWFQVTNKSDLSLKYPLMLNPNGGNVLVGDITGQNTLRVNGLNTINMAPVFSLYRSASAEWVMAGYGSSLLFGINPSSASDANLLSSAKFFINSAGNVGIGTTNPLTKLHVNVQTQGNFGVRTPQLSGITTGVQLNSFTDDGNGNNPMEFKANQFLWSVSGTEKMRIDTNGNVGINTTTPDAKLQVNGTFHVSGGQNSVSLDKLIGTGNRIVMADAGGALYATSTSVILPPGSATLPTGTINGQTLHYATSSSSWITDSNLISNGTSVGIGTTNPLAPLNISNPLTPDGASHSSSAWMKLGNSLNESTDIWYKGSTDDLYIDNRGNYDSADIIFRTKVSGTPVDAMKITGSGSVGIGTTNPTNKLQVYGNTILGKISGYPFNSVWSWDSDNSGYYSGIGYQDTSGSNKKLYVWWRDNILETNINSVLNIATPGHTFDGTAPNIGRTIGASISASGNSYFNAGSVGIGTIAPGYKLDTFTASNTDAYNRFQREDTTRPVGLALANSSVNQAYIYLPSGSNDLRFYNGGDRMTIQSGGNVGIGTTNPYRKLSVEGSATIGTLSDGNLNWMPSVGDNQLFLTSVTAAAINTGSTLSLGGRYRTSDNGQIAYASIAGLNETGSGYGNGYLALFTSNSIAAGSVERMRINSSGNVGIGTTNPLDKLHVAGNVRIDNLLNCSGTGSAVKTDATGRLVCGTIAGGVTGTGTSSYVARWTGASTLGTGVLYDNGTKVGIGTTTLTAPLTIQQSDDSSGFKLIGKTDPTTVFSFYIGAGGSNNPRFNSSKSMVFEAANAIHLRGYSGGVYINSDNNQNVSIAAGGGNVGIGTVAPGYKLDTFTASTTDAYNRFQREDTTRPVGLALANSSVNQAYIYLPAGSNDLRFYNGGDRMTIQSGGNVGIGTTNPLVKFDVNQGAYGWPMSTGTIQTYGALRLRAESSGNVVLDMGVNGSSGTWLQTTNKTDLSQEYPLLLNPNGGNVGIGTTNPLDKLHVAGNVRIDNLLNCSGTGSAVKTDATGRLVCGTIAGGITGTGTSSYVARWTGASTLGTGVLYDNGTNVGIGTTSPSSAKLHIAGSGTYDSVLRLTNTAVSGGDYFILSSNSGWTAGNNKLLFGAGDPSSANTKLVLDSTGNVGVGLVSPNSRLHVYNASANAEIDVQSLVGNGNHWGLYSNLSDNSFRVWGGSDYLTILRTGNVGIGMTNPVQKLDVSGKIALDGTVIAYRPTAFVGTLIFGNGGSDLSHTAGNEGYYNTFVGLAAGDANTTGNYNTANGYGSLFSNTTGNYNTANGVNSLMSNTTGNYNTANGVYSGRYISGGGSNQTSYNSTYFGYDTRALADGDYNENVFGYRAIGNGNNSVTLGNDSITKTILKGSVGIGTTTPDSPLQVNGNFHVSGGQNSVSFDKLIGVGGRIVMADPGGALYATSTSVILPPGTATLPTGVNGQTLRNNGTGWEATSTVFVKSDGTVGIGTANPGQKLDVAGNISLTGSILGKGDSSAKTFYNLASYNYVGNITGAMVIQTNVPQDDSTMTSIDVAIYELTSNGAACNITIGGYWSTEANSGFQTLGYTSNCTNKYAITIARNNSTGKVAIILGSTGTVWVYPKIAVTRATLGHSIVDSYADSWAITNTADISGYINSDVVPDKTLLGGLVQSTVSGTNYFTGGNLGIGIANPNSKLHIYSTSTNAEIDIQSLVGAGNHWATYSNLSDNSYRIWGGSDYLTILRNGNVGVGTTNPSSYGATPGKLEVSGFNNDTDGGIIIRGGATDRNANLYFITDNGANTFDYWRLAATTNASDNNDFRIGNYSGSSWTDYLTVKQSSGNVGIGTTNPGYKLDIFTASTTDAYNRFQREDTTRPVGLALANSSVNQAYIYLPAGSNDLRFYNGGDRMTILSGGNVGVGTTSPATKFQVYGNGTYAASFMSGNVGIGVTNPGTKLEINNQAAFNTTTPGTSLYGLHFSGQSTADYASGITWNGGGSASTAQAGLYVQGSGSYGTKMYFATTNAYVTGAQTRMMIDNNGKVGIGTVNPGAILDVNGSFRTNSSVTFSQLGGGGLRLVTVDNSGVLGATTTNLQGTVTLPTGTINGQTLHYATSSSSWITDSNLISNGTSVGIGTAAPNYKLDVNLGSVSSNANIGYNVFADATTNVGYSGYNLQLNNSTSNISGYLRLARTASTAFLGMELASQSRDGIRFLTHTTSPVEVMRINSSGNVGIGTTSPFSKLHLYDAAAGPIISLSGLNTNYRGLTIKDTSNNEQWFSGANNLNNFVIRRSGTTDNFTIASTTGNVGIGTSNPLNTLSVKGDGATLPIFSVTASSTISYMHFYNSTTGTSGYNDGLSFGINGLNAYLYNREAGPMYFGTNNLTRMTVDSSGNVGIGTTAPTAATLVVATSTTNYTIDAGNFRIGNVATPASALDAVNKTYLDSVLSAFSPVARFVTSTPVAYNGNQGGYTGANALCHDASPGSHVCTSYEILYTINSGHADDMPNKVMWISNGPPGYTVNANDCLGWSTAAGSGNYASIWVKIPGSNQGYGALHACSEVNYFACCK